MLALCHLDQFPFPCFQCSVNTDACSFLSWRRSCFCGVRVVSAAFQLWKGGKLTSCSFGQLQFLVLGNPFLIFLWLCGQHTVRTNTFFALFPVSCQMLFGFCGSVFIWINLWAWHFWVAVASLYDTLYTKVTFTALKTVKRVYLSYITRDKTCTSFFPKSKAFSWFLFIWHLYFALAEFYSAGLNWTSSNAESWNCKGAIIRWVLIWGKNRWYSAYFVGCKW